MTNVTNQSRQTLFEALVVYAKAPVNKNGDHQVIFKNDKISHLNAFDKIKISISNFFGNKRLNELKADMYTVSAKDSITNKLKDNLLKNQSASEKEKNKNLINKTDLADTIAEDFLIRAISHIKNKSIYTPQKSIPLEHHSNSGFTDKPYEELNTHIEKLQNISHNSLGHLPILVKAVSDNPSIKKLITILSNENYSTKPEEAINPQKLVTMAEQASVIKEKLKCDSKKAIEYIKMLDQLEIDSKNKIENFDNGTYTEKIEKRVNNFIQVKKKINPDKELAGKFSLMMENEIFIDNEHHIDIKDRLKIIKNFFSAEKNAIKNIVNSYNKQELLEKVIDNYFLAKNKSHMKNYLYEKEKKLNGINIDRLAGEMTNIAYIKLNKEEKFDAAVLFINAKNNANKEGEKIEEKESRIEFAKQIKEKIHTDLPLDEEGNYDRKKDEFFYIQH